MQQYLEEHQERERREVHRAARRRDIGGKAVVVLDVTRGQLRCRLAFELGEQIRRHLAEDVHQHVQAPAVRHAEHDLLHAVRSGALDQLVHRRDEALAALERKALLADVLGMQVALEVLGLGQLLRRALFSR